MAASAKAAKAAKVSRKRKPRPRKTLAVPFKGTPALLVKWLSDAVYQEVSRRVNDWLEEASCWERDGLNELVIACVESGCTTEEIDDAIQDYLSKLETCPVHSQTPAKAWEHVQKQIGWALEDLLEALVEQAYQCTSYDRGMCQLPEHREFHRSENRFILQEMDQQIRLQLRRRVDIWQGELRGGKKRLIRDSHEKAVKLAREYENLKNDKAYGDRRDKALWEIICHRYDSPDPKWRERAKLDSSDVPDAVLDLLPQRERLKLKTSHLALYHAACRAKISFSISWHTRTGEPFIKPSPRTLMRVCADAMPTDRGRLRRRKRITSAALITQATN